MAATEKLVHLTGLWRGGGLVVYLIDIWHYFVFRMQTLVGQGASDHVGALQQIPRNMRSLFLHALQSFLWNKAASHRVEAFGVEGVQVGDLVLPLAADVQTPGKKRFGIDLKEQ